LRPLRALNDGTTPPMITAYAIPILLLSMSNIFMTAAWYGHLRYDAAPLWIVVMISWGIAFFEYCLAIPANRLGYEVYSLAQLKTIQEVVTLTVFIGFSILYFKEPVTVNTLVGFGLIATGAYFVFAAPL
jgi:uncharacterized protein